MRTARGIAVAIVLAAIAIGCRTEVPKEEPPDTVPVTGKVVDRKGHPLVGGVVEFRAVDGKPWTTMAITAGDGTFTLETMVTGEKVPGAVVGEHRVSVTPPFSDSPEQIAAEPYLMPGPLTVKSDGENHFLIDMRR